MIVKLRRSRSTSTYHGMNADVMTSYIKRFAEDFAKSFSNLEESEQRREGSLLCFQASFAKVDQNLSKIVECLPRVEGKEARVEEKLDRIEEKLDQVLREQKQMFLKLAALFTHSASSGRKFGAKAAKGLANATATASADAISVITEAVLKTPRLTHKAASFVTVNLIPPPTAPATHDEARFEELWMNSVGEGVAEKVAEVDAYENRLLPEGRPSYARVVREVMRLSAQAEEQGRTITAAGTQAAAAADAAAARRE